MEEYNIKNVDELEQTLIEFCKSGEILYKCDCCGCQTLRESDRYCPECGGKVEE
jgi:rRNA maturation endonuclease Nob1